MMNEDKDKVNKLIGFKAKNNGMDWNSGINTGGTNKMLLQQDQISLNMDMMMSHRKGNEFDEQQSVPPCGENNELNSSLRLQTSYCSTHSNESDLSIALELELNSLKMNVESDELPAFQIRTMSPLGRSPSPIDTCNISQSDLDLEETPTRLPESQYNRQDDPNYVALHEINAQISPPSDDGGGYDPNNITLSRTSSLETIFENIFLHTPPPNQQRNIREGGASHTPKRRRSILFERLTMNRLHAGKENQSSAANQTPTTTTPQPHIFPREVGPNEEVLSPAFTEKFREVRIDTKKVVVTPPASPRAKERPM